MCATSLSDSSFLELSFSFFRDCFEKNTFTQNTDKNSKFK